MFRLILLTALLLPAASFAAVDAKFTDSCAGCHGDNGLSSAQDVPTIAGVSATVTRDALKAYRAKSAPYPKLNCKCGDTSREGAMCTVAKNLSDAQIADLADYFAKLPYAAQKQPFDAGKAAAGKLVHDRDCKKCHSAGGKDPSDDAGILAGQPLQWLKAALTSFQQVKREQPKKMQDVTSKLSGADIEALANFYASEE